MIMTMKMKKQSKKLKLNSPCLTWLTKEGAWRSEWGGRNSREGGGRFRIVEGRRKESEGKSDDDDDLTHACKALLVLSLSRVKGFPCLFAFKVASSLCFAQPRGCTMPINWYMQTKKQKVWKLNNNNIHTAHKERGREG